MPCRIHERAPEPAEAGVSLLCADIGGTHARLARVVAGAGRAGAIHVADYRTYVCAEWSSLEAILADFLSAQPAVAHGVLACAGYVLDGTVINDNLPWHVSIPRLRQTLACPGLFVINDFEALAYATRHLAAGDSLLLSGPETADAGPVLVVGPGTGLGAAVCMPGPGHGTVLAGEGGQISLAPGNERETRVLARLRQCAGGHVSYEYALSGPGLCRLYTAVCEWHDVVPRWTQPAQISLAATAGDTTAAEALDIFCALLGSFAGDLAMLYGAAGGVYLAGGILPKMRHFLLRSRFIERFLDKGRMRAFLERIPVRLMEHGQPGVVGAASWFLGRQDGE